MKRIVSLVTALTLLISLVTAMPVTSADNVAEGSITADKIQVGDYIQLGSYNGKPIRWRCIGYGKSANPTHPTNYAPYPEQAIYDRDYIMYEADGESGEVPLFIADEVLCQKAFDASSSDDNIISSSHDTQEERKESGSNLWSDSNIHAWLNSDAPAGNVVWTCGNPPDSEHVKDALGNSGTGYDQEAGFLTNFTPDEQMVMMTVRQKNFMGVSDSDGNDLTTQYGYDRFYDTITENIPVESFPTYEYDVGFYRLSTDTMFLPDIKQLDVMYKNCTEDKLGADYYKGEYLLRSPLVTFKEKDIYVKAFYDNGNNLSICTANSEHGIRPAFYAKNTATTVSGDGSKDNPYILQKPAADDMLSAKNIKIGDYVELGTYYGEKITWRCIGFDKIDHYDDDGTPVKYDGNSTVGDSEIRERGEWQEGYIPIMVSDKILTFKAYDAAAEPDKIAGTSHERGRDESGSNYWGDSNMRSWLNSDADAGEVEWLCGNPPDAEHVGEGVNPYADEAGFLNAFSDEEISAIKIVSKRTVLSPSDKDLKDSGNGTYDDNNYSYKGSTTKYDAAYAQYTRDKIFLPDVRHILMLSDSRSVDANIKSTGYPTNQALAHADRNMTPFATDFYPYWVGTAGHYASDVYIVFYDQYASITAWRNSADNSANSYTGVRPAFYLDVDATFKQGSGTEGFPYSFDAPSVNVSIDIGEYVQMGEYNGEPILWRCIGEDEYGKAMISDKILTVKPYDAAGSSIWGTSSTQLSSHYRKYDISETKPENRTSAGSNYWGDSNMRSWLNSDAEKGKVGWLCGNPPYADKCYNGINAYDQDEGFLRNFTKKELNAMQTFSNDNAGAYHSLIVIRDNASSYATLGFITNPAGAIETLPEKCENLTYVTLTGDKLILPDATHLGLMWKNRDILGDKYYMAKPTAECVENTESKPYGLSPYNYFSYWLTLPTGGTDNLMRIVNGDGSIGSEYAYNGEVGGVRPLFYLSKDSTLADGKGTADDPYVMDKPEATPSLSPTTNPTSIPATTAVPTLIPTMVPATTSAPILIPTMVPAATSAPTSIPTAAPTATPGPTYIPVTSAEITRTDTETDTSYTFEVDAADKYENCYVYAAVYDENGTLLSVKRAPLETADKTSISVSKSPYNALAKVFIWSDTLQPVTAAKEFELTPTATLLPQTTADPTATAAPTAAPIATAAPTAEIIDAGECGADGDNVTYTLDGNGILTISGEGEMKAYSAPITVPAWNDKRSAIKSVVIEDGVTSVGMYTFYDCSNLSKVTFSNSVTSIGDGAFADCSSLTSVTIPEKVTIIGNFAFGGCSSLTSTAIPDGITFVKG